MSLNSLLVFALSFLIWDVWKFSIRFIIVILIFSMTYLLFRTHFLEKRFNMLFSRFIGNYSNIHCNKLHYPRIFTASSLEWTAFIIGLYIMIKSFYTININQAIIITGLFSISWLVGYYTFLSPGGLGIQEGVQVYIALIFLSFTNLYYHCVCLATLDDPRRYDRFPTRYSSDDIREPAAKVYCRRE